MTFWSTLKSTLSSFFQTIGDAIKVAYKKTKDVCHQIYDYLKAQINRIWTKISSFFSSLRQKIIDLLKHI